MSIREALIENNPWWKYEFKLNFKERELYNKIQKFMSMPHIISITGIRRVGKTTLMHKIIVDAIDNGIDPQNIVYFTFDEFHNIKLKEIFDEYTLLFHKDLKKGKYLFLFDEIQKLNYWSEQLKRLYDVYSKNIKFIISGSESLFIQKGFMESLAGRLFEFKLNLLSFREYLNFRGIEYKPIELYEKELKRLFEEFILSQGFPELVNIKDKDIIKKYIKESIIEKVIYRDLMQLLKLRDYSLLESLLKIFMNEPGQIINLSDLASDLGTTRQTISKYITYLERAFLLRKLYNFSKNTRKIERKLKKYYPTIISPNLLFQDNNLIKSKIFEWCLVIQLNAKYFWRDERKNEVDIIIKKDDNVIPIEIKYGKINFSGLKNFLNQFNINIGNILTSTKEYEKKFNEKIIRLIPVFKYLLNHQI
ncbi:MAG: ATP-binding protein [Promethearchaeota archaeon]